MLECTVVRKACLSVHSPQPECSKTCRQRPFSLKLHGADAAVDAMAVRKERAMLKDPLNAFQLRHLEQDIAPAAEGEPPAGPYEQGPPPIMIWPEFESGFGDVIMWTLLPLGWLLATGALPNGTLMISGALFTRSWEPLTAIRNVCTTERYDRVEDQRLLNVGAHANRRGCGGAGSGRPDGAELVELLARPVLQELGEVGALVLLRVLPGVADLVPERLPEGLPRPHVDGPRWLIFPRWRGGQQARVLPRARRRPDPRPRPHVGDAAEHLSAHCAARCRGGTVPQA